MKLLLWVSGSPSASSIPQTACKTAQSCLLSLPLAVFTPRSPARMPQTTSSILPFSTVSHTMTTLRGTATRFSLAFRSPNSYQEVIRYPLSTTRKPTRRSTSPSPASQPILSPQKPSLAAKSSTAPPPLSTALTRSMSKPRAQGDSKSKSPPKMPPQTLYTFSARRQTCPSRTAPSPSQAVPPDLARVEKLDSVSASPSSSRALVSVHSSF